MPEQVLRFTGGLVSQNFLDSQHKNVVRLSAVRIGRLYPT